MIARVGQTTTHAGSSPTSRRCAHRLHFSAEWSSGLMKIASYGHAAMHALQPMHACLSKSTMPSGRRYMAAVGQAATQGASSHWLHRVTWKARRVWGNVPTSTYFTYVRLTPRGTSFSDLQAVVQAWQPMQAVWSMTLAHREAAVATQGTPGTAVAVIGPAPAGRRGPWPRSAARSRPGRTGR